MELEFTIYLSQSMWFSGRQLRNNGSTFQRDVYSTSIVTNLNDTHTVSNSRQQYVNTIQTY